MSEFKVGSVYKFSDFFEKGQICYFIPWEIYEGDLLKIVTISWLTSLGHHIFGLPHTMRISSLPRDCSVVQTDVEREEFHLAMQSAKTAFERDAEELQTQLQKRIGFLQDLQKLLKPQQVKITLVPKKG